MKRSTKRQLRHGGLYVLLVLALLGIVLGVDWESVKFSFFNANGLSWHGGNWQDLIFIGAKNTVIYTVIAFVGGLVLALGLALAKLSPVAAFRWLATGYIEFFRGLPALVVILAMAFAVPIAFQGWTPPEGRWDPGCWR